MPTLFIGKSSGWKEEVSQSQLSISLFFVGFISHDIVRPFTFCTSSCSSRRHYNGANEKTNARTYNQQNADQNTHGRSDAQPNHIKKANQSTQC